MAETLITSQVGKREQLSDLIALSDLKATPVYSLANKSKDLVNPLFSWQANAYNVASYDGVLSNEDVSTYVDPAANRALLSGRIQKFWQPIKVDDLAANVTDVAGIGKGKELANGIRQAIVEVKRAIESAICSDNDSVVQSGATPYKTRGLGSWISSSAQADTATAVPAAYRTPAASIDATAMASVTESTVNAVLESIYTQVGERKTYTLVCGPKLKSAFSALTRTQFASTNTGSAVKTYSTNASDKKIIASVDLFDGDFGVCNLLPSLFLAKNTSDAASLRRGYVLDMDCISIKFNRMPEFKELPDLGGGPRGVVSAILGLAIDCNPLEFGKFNATT